MQSCISYVKALATANMLKLNDSKTELMLVTSKRSKHLHNLPTSITIGNAQIPFKQSVKIWVWHLFVDSLQVLQLPHLYLLLFCQELTTVTHCCLVLLIMLHPTCNGYRTMQLE